MSQELTPNRKLSFFDVVDGMFGEFPLLSLAISDCIESSDDPEINRKFDSKYYCANLKQVILRRNTFGYTYWNPGKPIINLTQQGN